MERKKQAWECAGKIFDVGEHSFKTFETRQEPSFLRKSFKTIERATRVFPHAAVHVLFEDLIVCACVV